VKILEGGRGSCGHGRIIVHNAIAVPADLAQAPAPAWIANCAVCGRIVDTREKAEGGDGHGCEYSNGWACSTDCAEKLNPDPDWMREDLAALEAADAGVVAELVEALRQFEAHYPRGINPFLDDAHAKARAVLAKIGGAA